MMAERMTICLEDFLKYLLMKWKTIGIAAVITMLLFAGMTYLTGGKITVPPSEEYLHYEKELAYHEQYLKDSILMNLDPTKVYARILFIRNVTDKELLKDYATSAEIWDDLETERAKTFISELVIWEENEETDTIELKLRHATSKECLEWAEYLKKQLETFDPGVEIQIGAEKIFAHESLQEEHLRWYSRIDYVKSLLLDAQAGYTITINPFAAIVTGGLIGGIASVFVLFLVYLLGNKVRSIEELEMYTGSKCLKPEELENCLKEQNAVVLNMSCGLKKINRIETVTMDELDFQKSNVIIIAAKINRTNYKELSKTVQCLEKNNQKIFGCMSC